MSVSKTSNRDKAPYLLFLAPHPFYQERGTPIAVRLLLETLAFQTPNLKIDLVTYHEGENIEIPNVTTYRIPAYSFLSGIRAGISLKKLVCDLLLLFLVFRLIFQKGIKHYDLVHAVEESVFIALILKLFFKIPYVYDMDSLLSLQTIEKWPKLKFLSNILIKIENIAIRKSKLVIAVCQTLFESAEKASAKHVVLLRDIPPQDLPFLKTSGEPENIRLNYCIPDINKIATYIGNLEVYQGVDLLLEGYYQACLKQTDNLKISLLIIGGPIKAVEKYQQKINKFPKHISDNIFLIGPKPLNNISHYMNQSDILVSPRILGNNTPMKIYGFIASGKPVIATNIKSHIEILNSDNSILIDPEPAMLAEAFKKLCLDDSLINSIGKYAKAEAETKYSLKFYQKSLLENYSGLLASIPK